MAASWHKTLQRGCSTLCDFQPCRAVSRRRAGKCLHRVSMFVTLAWIPPRTSWSSSNSLNGQDTPLCPRISILILFFRNAETKENVNRLHLLSLEKNPGTPHPLAPPNAVLSHVKTGAQIHQHGVSYTITISGDFIGLLVNFIGVAQNEFLVWNWKTGRLNLVCLSALATRNLLNAIQAPFWRRDSVLLFPIRNARRTRHTLA